MSIARSTLLAASAVLLWSTAASAFKLALRALDPYQLLFIAGLTSFLALLLVQIARDRCAALRELLKNSPRRALRCALKGTLNPPAYYLLLFNGYNLLPAQTAQALNSTWVIALSLLSVPLLGHRLSRRDVVALGAGWMGVVIIACGGEFSVFSGPAPAGVLCVLASAVIWATYWLLERADGLPADISLLLHFGFALPWLGLICLVMSPPLPLEPAAWLPAIYVGLFEMSLTFLLWAAALRASDSAARTGSLAFFSPFLSLCWIALVLGERIAPATVLGLACIAGAALWQRRG